MPYSNFYVVWRDGKVVEINSGEYELREANNITLYDTQEEVDAVPEVIEFRAIRQAAADMTRLRSFDTVPEYQGKQENAMRWRENNRNLQPVNPLYETGDYTPEKYPWLQIEIETFGMTPRECVESIINAINRTDSQWQAARDRAKMRKDMSGS